MSVRILDKNGAGVEINLNDMELHREAADKGVTFRQLVNEKYPTAPDAKADTFQQMCMSAGIRFKKNKKTGQPASTAKEVLYGARRFEAGSNQTGGTYTSQPAAPDSRILFMPAILELIEDQLESKEGAVTQAFEDIIGLTDVVASAKTSQPVISYKGKGGPEDMSFNRISQNSNPNIMLSLTASDVDRVIPTASIGMEISNQALNTGIDHIALSLARFFKKVNYNEYVTAIGKILNGDPDATVTPMSAAGSALPSITAQSLDSSISAAGEITHLAWMKFLYRNSLIMTKTNVVMDFDTAIAIDTRTGRPDGIVTGDGGARIDVPMTVTFPTFDGGAVKALVMPDGTFPTNTIMALDREYAIGKTISSTADYEAMEDMVLRRAKALRIDRGWIMYRQYDDAFDVMTLTV